MSGEDRAVAVYRLLVRLYPRSFRDQFGPDLVQLLRDQYREEPAGRVLARAAVDLAITIPTQHLETTMHRNPNPVVPFLYLAIAVAGVTVAATVNTNPTTLFLSLGVALVSGVVAVIGLRRLVSDGGGQPVAASWWKVLAAGPALLAAVVIGARLGIDVWFLALGLVVLGLLLTAAGVILGIVRLAARRPLA